jgi:putative glycerol-1-phosphate prenyltransferase
MAIVYKKIQENREKGHKMLGILIDPDKYVDTKLEQTILACNEHSVDFLLVGGSLLMKNRFDVTIDLLKEQSKIPVLIFPGNGFQINKKADALLFTSLLSGRNPEYLIGQQVQAAPMIREAGLATIATAYLLIESGGITSVSYVSNTQPIPAEKPDIAMATALAAAMMGMQMVYLEAGSGAKFSVPNELIRQVRAYIQLPIICGGGIRDASTANEKYQAGADIVVIGNGAEQQTDLIKEVAMVRNQFYN